jgi:uncharacterized protein YbgA (DUF1722 family)
MRILTTVQNGVPTGPLARDTDPYMERQHYLHPFPDELSLRNAI